MPSYGHGLHLVANGRDQLAKPEQPEIPVPECGKGIAPGRGLVLWLSVGWGILGLHIQGKGVFGIPEQATFTGSLAGERSPVT